MKVPYFLHLRCSVPGHDTALGDILHGEDLILLFIERAVYYIYMNKTSISTQEEVDKNYTFFKKELPNLITQHRGEFVLIKEQTIEGYFKTFEEAFFAGKKKFEDSQFSIQEVTEDPVDLGSMSAYAVF